MKILLKGVFLFCFLFIFLPFLFAIESAVIIGDVVNVRSLPSLKGDIKYQLRFGEEIELIRRSTFTSHIEGISSNWALVQQPGGPRGWVFGTYVSPRITNNSFYVFSSQLIMAAEEVEPPEGVSAKLFMNELFSHEAGAWLESVLGNNDSASRQIDFPLSLGWPLLIDPRQKLYSSCGESYFSGRPKLWIPVRDKNGKSERWDIIIPVKGYSFGWCDSMVTTLPAYFLNYESYPSKSNGRSPFYRSLNTNEEMIVWFEKVRGEVNTLDDSYKLYMFPPPGSNSVPVRFASPQSYSRDEIPTSLFFSDLNNISPDAIAQNEVIGSITDLDLDGIPDIQLKNLESGSSRLMEWRDHTLQKFTYDKPHHIQVPIYVFKNDRIPLNMLTVSAREFVFSNLKRYKKMAEYGKDFPSVIPFPKELGDPRADPGIKLFCYSGTSTLTTLLSKDLLLHLDLGCLNPDAECDESHLNPLFWITGSLPTPGLCSSHAQGKIIPPTWFSKGGESRDGAPVLIESSVPNFFNTVNKEADIRVWSANGVSIVSTFIGSFYDFTPVVPRSFVIDRRGITTFLSGINFVTDLDKDGFVEIVTTDDQYKEWDGYQFGPFINSPASR